MTTLTILKPVLKFNAIKFSLGWLLCNIKHKLIWYEVHDIFYAIISIISNSFIIFQVQLIEQLDRACIRFVHFSKENELRSRVFSEKMGLESGWNCHISLLSEGARYQINYIIMSFYVCNL